MKGKTRKLAALFSISVVHLTVRKRNASVSSFSTYRGHREPLGSLEAVLNFQ